MNKMISIITPIYNAEKYLSKTIESVITQSYQNWELIAVNDGSKDNSLEIINNFAQKDNRIKVFNIKNSGQTVASNYGIKKSSGEYIKFLDADDIISENHLERQYKSIEKIPNSLASCEWGRFYNNDYKSAQFIPESVWKNMNSLDWLKASLIQENDMMPAWLWLIPREILYKAGFWNEKLSLNNDFDFSVRLLLAAEEVKFAKGAKIYYRSGVQNSLSQEFSKKAIESAYLTTLLGCNNILKINSSNEIKKLCANRYQTWIYRIYPKHKLILNQFQEKVIELGGATIKCEGGKLFISLRKIFGWKIAKKIQLLFHAFGWLKISKSINRRVNKNKSKE